MKAKKLPVPEGFRRLRSRDIIEAGDRVDRTGVRWEPVAEQSVGGPYVPGLYFPMIRAIKRPTPKPAPAKAKRAGKPVKAKIVKQSSETARGYCIHVDSFVLPADAESVEKMIAQMNRAVRPDLFSDDPNEAHRAASPYTVESRRAEVDSNTRIALSSIGIKA